ncbi:putative bifunctional diguanylate cyclase/phosphodiesterase [Bordetella genomosp. 13]|uniref:putative bifunctional diguanylate cyclase/phosphodiesterase n=1 Tax=Bordetella genomosp. 13 TaxID=463040 RepID=UPI001642CE37|nr:EAL domain-containing protein [Bordetella genomosp. 13]
MKHRVTLTDLGMLAAVIAVLAYLCVEFDLFLTEGSTSADERIVELDEMLLVGGVLMLGLLIFSLRRYREQKREMAQRRQAERQARELAYQDPLTGLPNRRQFEEALRVAVASPPSAGAVHAVLMLDLNGFKQVNDVRGHDVGDAVLVVVAQRLLGAVRAGEMVARLGGDEFVILAQHLTGPESASGIALRVIQGLAEPLPAGGGSHSIGVGIGITLLPGNAATAEEAVRKADVALYRAKSERRSAFRFFEEEMDRLVQERAQLERLLKDAILAGRVQPRFVPTHDLQSGRIVGFEATPYWVADDGEELPPERFLPTAEETGLVHLLAERLLEQACAVALQWPDDVTLAINVLPGQLKDRQLAAGILQRLRQAGLAPARLQVDIPENMVVQDPRAARGLIDPLQQAGVRIALDHFGTGYSNLYHMREFRFDKVKIDRRLVEHMDDESNARLVRALVGLGQGLGTVVSADGVGRATPDLLDSGVQEGQAGDLSVNAGRTLDYFRTA